MMTRFTITFGLLFLLSNHVSADDFLERLEKLPLVASVKVTVACKNPRHRILNIKDWHFVEREAYAADLRDQSDEPISEKEIDAVYAELLSEVERVQAEQMEVVRHLVKEDALKSVFVEGLSKQDKVVFDAVVRWLRRKKATLQTHRPQLLRIGAAGRLYLVNEVDFVHPLDVDGFQEKFNPVGEDGKVELDARLIEEREDTQVRALLEHEGLSVVILGGGHDLTDNLKRLGEGRCEYVQVETRGYRRANTN